MAVDWEANCKKKWKQIRELAWRGVPNPMRTLVWPLLAGVRSTEDSLKTRYPQLLAVSLGSIVARRLQIATVQRLSVRLQSKVTSIAV